MVFVRRGGVKKHKKSFFKFTPLIWAIEGQNNKSYRGDLDLQKKKTISYILPVFSFESLLLETFAIPGYFLVYGKIGHTGVVCIFLVYYRKKP